ncbi:MAG: MotA/TolQ/ExbB proton channel family protein [Lentisphaerae bacterium]|nr:MotA/TolQ/ExbB proton channel family protein [Lentisphaerota bacterium]
MINLFLPQIPLAGVVFALKQSNTAGKAIVAVLFIGSILAWTVMVVKLKELNDAKRASSRFLFAYRREKHPLSLFMKNQKYDDSPLYTVYKNACVLMRSILGVSESEKQSAANESWFETAHLTDGQAAAVKNMVSRTVADESLAMEENMGFLATATTTAPFLGLLGTVWGVMEAFGGMAVKGSAMLSDVAPGISGALLTTVVGLLVALPSAIGYNILSDQIRRMGVLTDNFSQELIGDLENHCLRQE